MRNFLESVSHGRMLMLGFDPIERGVDGFYKGSVSWNHPLIPWYSVTRTKDSILSGLDDFATNDFRSVRESGAAMKAFCALTLVGTASNVLMGFQAGGILGALGALNWDLAMNAAVAYHSLPTAKGAIDKLDKPILRGIGALIGSGIGGSIGGPIGTWAGAYIGAAPVKFVTKSPGLAAAAAVSVLGYGATKLVAKGSYEVLKQGFHHAQRKKALETSGDLSAHMTQAAVTMRQRAVSAIQKSHLNARSALGQEASLMHMSQRNYFSKYR
jgi:hypothetical protein